MSGSELATLEDYRAAGKFLVLAPVVEIASRESAVSPWLVESVSVVKISTDDASPDVYNDFRYAKRADGLFALSALGLSKIAVAAGIKWVPELTGLVARERRPNGHVYVRFRGAGAVRQLNGEWHVELAEKEVDTEDEAESLEDGYRRKIAAGRARYSEGDIPDMVRRDMLQIREFVLGMAETKAKNRVIRRILSLKQVYSKRELERPIAVPRLLHVPQVADEAGRVALEGRSVAESLYGPAAELPDQTSASPSEPSSPSSPEAHEDPASATPAQPAAAASEPRRRGARTATPPPAGTATKTRRRAPEPDEPPLEEPPGWEQDRAEEPAAQAAPTSEQGPLEEPAPPASTPLVEGTTEDSFVETRDELLNYARRLFAPDAGPKVADARLVAAGKMLHACETVDDLDDAFLRELIAAREAFTQGGTS